VSKKIAVVGLGYVGLPVAVAFARQFQVIGYDLSETRVAELTRGFDRTGEVADTELANATGLRVTTSINDLTDVDDFIMCVPTPIDADKRPDLGPLIAATQDVGRVLRPGCLVVFESTVYPGATEETCIPILEAESGLLVNEDFWVGYSPERINPGDPHHRFDNTHKVVSGSSPEGLDKTEALYAAVLNAPIHRAPSIKVAEAAKVIENTQRDLNIALINELAKIFELLDIDTQDVLAAAQTKWNFLPFQPGLVGGHCIGVDPYYLTHRAQEVGFEPETILAGRAINDSMGAYIANRVVRLISDQGRPRDQRRVLVLGATFKENCPDLRNSKALDLVAELHKQHVEVFVSDPLVEKDSRHFLQPAKWVDFSDFVAGTGTNAEDGFDAVVLAVAHNEFQPLRESIRSNLRPGGIVFDVKGFLPSNLVDARL